MIRHRLAPISRAVWAACAARRPCSCLRRLLWARVDILQNRRIESLRVQRACLPRPRRILCNASHRSASHETRAMRRARGQTQSTIHLLLQELDDVEPIRVHNAEMCGIEMEVSKGARG